MSQVLFAISTSSVTSRSNNTILPERAFVLLSVRQSETALGHSRTINRVRLVNVCGCPASSIGSLALYALDLADLIAI